MSMRWLNNLTLSDAAFDQAAPDPAAESKRAEEAALVASLPPTFAYGGHGSTERDPFFDFIDKAVPGAHKMWLRGSGKGIAGIGVNNAGEQMKRDLLANPNSLFIGNSISAPLLRKAISEVDPQGTNTARQQIYVDPPDLSQYPFPVNPPRPFSYLSPTATLIKDQVRGGIMNDTNTVSFTQGKWLDDAKHSPWINPALPGNAENIAKLTKIINSKRGATATNATAKTPN